MTIRRGMGVAEPRFEVRNNSHEKETNMLSWSILFLIVALIAGALGLAGVAAVSSEIAWVLFVVFMIFFVLSLLFRSPRVGPPI